MTALTYDITEKIVAVDLDGTCWNLIDAVLKHIPMNTVEYESLTHYHVWQKLPVTETVFFQIIVHLQADEITLFPDTKEILRKIQQRCRKLYFLTNKTDNMMGWTRDVLRREGLDDIDIVQSPSVKYYKANSEYPFDILIDDAPKNILACQTQSRDCLIYDNPWNRHIDGIRVHSWKEIQHLFQLS